VFRAITGDREPGLLLRRAVHLTRDCHPSSSVAETPAGEIIGATIARQLGPVVLLAWAIVDERFQSQGIMRNLLRAFPAQGEASQRVILSSPDPKAMRRYSALGLRLHPAVAAAGILRPGAVRDPGGVIECSPVEAASVIEPIANAVRRAPFGRDLELMTAQGDRAHVLGSDAVVIRRGGVIRQMLARTEEAASLALRGALAAVPPGVTVHIHPLVAGQDWAIRLALDAGLALSPDGPVFSDHPLSPLHVPNGALF
jgi:hypothetical protein